jgi:16S rRNA (guanine(966)-N(2))-methyltransferase RsmD
MRIVAGTAKGRVLATPKSDDVIRPTADRVRETLFNVLGQWCEGLSVLDLFAGTGALGFEALSRGAVKATFVDHAREAQDLIRLNAETLKFTPQVELVTMSVSKGLLSLGARKATFDLVFIDPPYAQEAGLATLTACAPVLNPGARVVVEHGKTEVLPQAVGLLEKVDERTFGLTVMSIFSNPLTAP